MIAEENLWYELIGINYFQIGFVDISRILEVDLENLKAKKNFWM